MFKRPTNQPKPEPSTFEEWFTQTRKLHFGFMGGIVMQGVVAIVIKQQIMMNDPGFVNLDPATFYGLLTVLSIVACVIVGVVFIILPKRSTVDHLLTKSFESPVALGKALSSETILRSTIVAAIAIFGLILFLMNGNLMHFAAFAAIAFVLLLLLFPRRSNWDEVLNVFRIARPEWRNL